MAVKAVCPDCRAEYSLADQQKGKKVRCKHCESVFVVGEAPRKKAEPPVVEVTEQPRAKARPTAVAARRTKPVQMAHEDDEDDDEEEDRGPKRGKGKSGSALPWIIGGGVALMLVVVIGAIVVAVAFKDDNKKPEVANSGERPVPSAPGGPPMRGGPPFPPGGGNPQGNGPVGSPPVLSGETVPVKPAEPSTKTSELETKGKQAVKPAQEDEDTGAPAGKLTDARKERVKRATVYLRVFEGNGRGASGTGFFGAPEAPNIILTNAHVVGMLAPDSPRPLRIEVFVNSGEPDEWKTEARVLGVDRDSDLAVLDMGKVPDGKVIKPLTVKPASKLAHLDTLYVFGFPLGEQLGKEITIREAKVSSFRRKNGEIVRVQVEGGMDPGNSGGPVVDSAGTVVGVAVSKIRGTQINFAIPASRVQAILSGRVAGLNVAQPYYSKDGHVTVPVLMDMIDPRQRVKDVALEVWAGDKPLKEKDAHRPPSTKQPEPQEGDLERKIFKLPSVGGERRADIILPDKPADKVWWQQPKWIDDKGQPHWAEAGLLKLPGDPVEHKPVNLVLHLTPNVSRNVTLTIDNALKISQNEDEAVLTIHTKATFLEKVQSNNVLNLKYKDAETEAVDARGMKHARRNFDKFKNDLPKLVTLLQLDSVGNIINQTVDPSALRGISQQQYKEMTDFHRTIQQGLEAMTVSLPPQGSAAPGFSWKGTRHLPIEAPGKSELGTLDMTYTYLGVRKVRGRDQAVVHVDGLVRGEREVGDAVSGRASGTIVVDAMSGQTIRSEVSVLVELEAVEVKMDDRDPLTLKLISLMKVKLERDLR